MKKLFPLFLFLITLFFAKNSSAQTPCDIAAEQAIEFYNQGRYDSLISFVKNQLNSLRCTSKQKEVLLKYAASAYYAIDNLEQGDLYLDTILHRNPYFESNPSEDPMPFTENLRRFVVSPRLAVGLKGGSNLSTMFITREYTIINPGESDYTSGLSTGGGFQAGLLIRAYFSSSISTSLELNYYSQSYERKIQGFRNSVITFNEDFNSFHIPVLINYSFRPNRKLIPEIYAGVYFSSLLSSNANVKATSMQFVGDTSGTGSIDEYGLAAFTDNIEMTGQRRLKNFGILAGARLMYRVNGTRIFAELRLSNDLKNFVEPDQRYSNPLLVYNYYYIDSDALIFTSEISVGVSIVLFHQINQRFK